MDVKEKGGSMPGFHALMYHEIIKREDFEPQNQSGIKVKQGYGIVLPQALFCYLDEFEKQMRYLSERGYHTLTLREVIDFYYNGGTLPEKAVLLSFDDMFKSVRLYAWPILKKYNFHAVGFVVLDWLFDGEQEYSPRSSVCMSKGELAQLRDTFEFANHTRSLHTWMGAQPAAPRIAQTAAQVADAESFTRDIMACEEFVTAKGVFAYPFGVYDEMMIKRLQGLGFKLAFTTQPGRNDAGTNPLALHRDAVVLNMDSDNFAQMMEK